jgi:hypothetical protein
MTRLAYHLESAVASWRAARWFEWFRARAKVRELFGYFRVSRIRDRYASLSRQFEAQSPDTAGAFGARDRLPDRDHRDAGNHKGSRSGRCALSSELDVARNPGEIFGG